MDELPYRYRQVERSIAGSDMPDQQHRLTVIGDVVTGSPTAVVADLVSGEASGTWDSLNHLVHGNGKRMRLVFSLPDEDPDRAFQAIMDRLLDHPAFRIVSSQRAREPIPAPSAQPSPGDEQYHVIVRVHLHLSAALPKAAMDHLGEQFTTGIRPLHGESFQLFNLPSGTADQGGVLRVHLAKRTSSPGHTAEAERDRVLAVVEREAWRHDIEVRSVEVTTRRHPDPPREELYRSSVVLSLREQLPDYVGAHLQAYLVRGLRRPGEEVEVTPVASAQGPGLRIEMKLFSFNPEAAGEWVYTLVSSYASRDANLALAVTAIKADAQTRAVADKLPQAQSAGGAPTPPPRVARAQNNRKTLGGP